MKTLKIFMMAVMVLSFTSGAFAMEGHDHSEQKMPMQKMPMQKNCPIMGGAINRNLFVEAQGKRIYVCCPGCIGEIKADPGKYIKEFADKGIMLEDSRK